MSQQIWVDDYGEWPMPSEIAEAFNRIRRPRDGWFDKRRRGWRETKAQIDAWLLTERRKRESEWE